MAALTSIGQLHSRRCGAPMHSCAPAARVANRVAFLSRSEFSGSSWTWIQQNRLECSLLLSRARQRSNRRCRAVVSSSLLGVGAPEVLVIAVVALLVFGPKGLAEVARSLGQSLRAFQPAIRELQDVSREFKQTLEKEIGLDELKASSQRPVEPTKPAQAPVNENFVIEEITAQLNRAQQEKEKEKEREKESTTAVAKESQQPAATPAIAASTSEANVEDNSSSPAPADVPAQEKEAAAVNNVPKD